MKKTSLICLFFLFSACQGEKPADSNESKTKFLTQPQWAASEANQQVAPIEAYNSHTQFLIEKVLRPIRYSVQILRPETTQSIPYDGKIDPFANQVEYRKALKNLGNQSDGDCVDYKEAKNMVDDSIKTWLRQLRQGMTDGRIPQEAIKPIPDPIFVAAPSHWNDVDVRIYYYCDWSSPIYYFNRGGERSRNPAHPLIQDNEPFILTQGARWSMDELPKNIESLGIKSKLAVDEYVLHGVFTKGHLLTNLGISFGLYAPNFFTSDPVRYRMAWQSTSLMMNSYSDANLDASSMSQEDADAFIWLYNYYFYPNFNPQSCTGSIYVKASNSAACVLP
jgi:hypothetical protein